VKKLPARAFYAEYNSMVREPGLDVLCYRHKPEAKAPEWVQMCGLVELTQQCDYGCFFLAD
jgi:hypothetical protein